MNKILKINQSEKTDVYRRLLIPTDAIFPSITNKFSPSRDHSKNICHIVSYHLPFIFIKYSENLEIFHWWNFICHTVIRHTHVHVLLHNSA